MLNKRVFCKFHKSCYFSDEIKKKGREKARIRSGKADLMSYVVTLAENPGEQLDIMRSIFLKSRRFKSSPPVICGIARSYKGATDIVLMMAEDAARAGMPGRLRDYLESIR